VGHATPTTEPKVQPPPAPSCRRARRAFRGRVLGLFQRLSPPSPSPCSFPNHCNLLTSLSASTATTASMHLHLREIAMGVLLGAGNGASSSPYSLAAVRPPVRPQSLSRPSTSTIRAPSTSSRVPLPLDICDAAPLRSLGQPSPALNTTSAGPTPAFRQGHQPTPCGSSVVPCGVASDHPAACCYPFPEAISTAISDGISPAPPATSTPPPQSADNGTSAPLPVKPLVPDPDPQTQPTRPRFASPSATRPPEGAPVPVYKPLGPVGRHVLSPGELALVPDPVDLPVGIPAPKTFSPDIYAMALDFLQSGIAFWAPTRHPNTAGFFLLPRSDGSGRVRVIANLKKFNASQQKLPSSFVLPTATTISAAIAALGGRAAAVVLQAGHQELLPQSPVRPLIPLLHGHRPTRWQCAVPPPPLRALRLVCRPTPLPVHLD
jgi:hypothetical protein